MFESIEFNHEQVRRYLLNTGWVKEKDLIDGVAELYVKDQKTVDLIIEPSLPTYTSYLKDTIQAISILEEENLNSLVESIERIGTYKLSLTIDEGKSGHRIRLTDSKKLRSGISDMLLAVSHSVLNPSINHPRLSKKEAVDLHAEFYEDQTARGSYIANFLIPDVKIESISGLMVMDKFKSALDASIKVGNREILPATTEYEELAKQGVSANFLSALSELKGIGSGSEQIKFKINENASFSFPWDTLSNLNDFYKEIITPANQTVTIQGKVVAITASPECTITIDSEVNNLKKIVKVKISSDQYKLVIEEEHRLLSSMGTLVYRPIIQITGILRSRSNGRHEIVEMSTFSIIAS